MFEFGKNPPECLAFWYFLCRDKTQTKQEENMTRNVYDIEILDANLLNEEDLAFFDGADQKTYEPELVEAWWQDDK